MLWLWAVAETLIQLLALEPTYAEGAALKRPKKLLIYNVVLVSGMENSESAIHIYISTPSEFLPIQIITEY